MNEMMEGRGRRGTKKSFEMNFSFDDDDIACVGGWMTKTEKWKVFSLVAAAAKC